jgi:hypothetical protein
MRSIISDKRRGRAPNETISSADENAPDHRVLLWSLRTPGGIELLGEGRRRRGPDHAPAHKGMARITAEKGGPRVVMFAGVHGDEVSGVHTIEKPLLRFFWREISLPLVAEEVREQA